MSDVQIFDLKKNYLVKAGSTQLAMAAFAAASITFPFIPVSPWLAVGTSAFAGFCGLKNIAAWFDTRDFFASLNSGNFFSVRRDEVHQERIKSTKDGKIQDNYYLGRGFTWTTKHLALYEQIKNTSEFESDTSTSNVAGGKPYIHNLGKVDEKPMVFNMKEHTLIAGESGSGKTVLLNLLNSQFIRDGEAVCVIDPKGDRDLMDSTRNECEACGRGKDFHLVSLTHLRKSTKFDPLKNSMSSNDAADRITAILGLDKKGDAFAGFCWNLLNTIGQVLLNCNMPLTLTLKNFYQYSLGGKMEPLFQKAQLIHSELTDPNQRVALSKSLEQLQVLVEHPGEHFSKMSVSLQPVLTALATNEAGELLNPAEEDEALTWEEIIKDKKVVYFNLSSMVDDRTSGYVCKLVVQDLISYIGQIYAYENRPHRIKLLCDEFYSIAYPGFGDTLNKSRAAGLQAILGLQTESDIAAVMDANMVDVILGNLPNKIYLRIGKDDLAERFTKLADEVEFSRIQKMSSVNATPTEGEILFRSGTNQRTQTEDRSIISPGMVKGLPQGQGFVYNKGMPMAKIAIPILEKVSSFSYFKDELNAEFSMAEHEFIALSDCCGHAYEAHR